MEQMDKRDSLNSFADVEQFTQKIIGREEMMNAIVYGFIQAIKVMPLLEDSPIAS